MNSVLRQVWNKPEQTTWEQVNSDQLFGRGSKIMHYISNKTGMDPPERVRRIIIDQVWYDLGGKA